ncbi:hypothetical protein [Actinomadura sp. 6N118]
MATDAGPDVPRAAWENPAFLGRAVRFAVESGDHSVHRSRNRADPA